MNAQTLISTAKTPVPDDMNLLAMAESHLIERKRLGRLGIFQTGRVSWKLIVTRPRRIP